LSFSIFELISTPFSFSNLINRAIHGLIQEKSGLIDDPQLRLEILPRATTHFLLIRLANKVDLNGNSDDFKDLTYPRELVSKLEVRKAQLEVDLENLNKREG
jgi:hypothetical protein